MLPSLEENGIKFALKAERKKTIVWPIVWKKDYLAILYLPVHVQAMERASIFSLLTNRAGNYATLLVITSHVSIMNNKIIEVEDMNLTTCKLAQKLVCLEKIKEDKFDVYSNTKQQAKA